MCALKEAFRPDVNAVGGRTAYYSVFTENAEKIGAEVYRAATVEESALMIQEILLELQPERVVAAPSPITEALRLDSLPVTNISLSNLSNETLKAEVGIFGVKMAVAETGSLVQIDPAMDERRVSSLTDINIALIPTDGIVPDFRTAMERVYRDFNPVPGYLSFISGPSRTSDIERVLTIGVHGPRRLIIIFIDQPIGG